MCTPARLRTYARPYHDLPFAAGAGFDLRGALLELCGDGDGKRRVWASGGDVELKY